MQRIKKQEKCTQQAPGRPTNAFQIEKISFFATDP